MSSDIRFSSFLLDSSSNAKKYFKTFLQVIVSIALTDFKIEDFLRDVILFYKQFCLKKATSFIQGKNSREKYSYFGFFCCTT